ncbi:MAG: hypothetical protein V1754_09485 [Pseudomonadota bacterium]
MCVVLIALSGCSTGPPLEKDGASVPEAGSGSYAAEAVCTPVSLGADRCPGESCAQNVLGKEDGIGLVLAGCQVLDVAFVGGVIRLSSPAEPDLAIHLVLPIEGHFRVEASADGEKYIFVGEFNTKWNIPKGSCLGQLNGTRVLFNLESCNTIDNIQFIRVLPLRNATGIFDCTIDAIEGISFVSAKNL